MHTIPARSNVQQHSSDCLDSSHPGTQAIQKGIPQAQNPEGVTRKASCTCSQPLTAHTDATLVSTLSLSLPWVVRLGAGHTACKSARPAGVIVRHS